MSAPPDSVLVSDLSQCQPPEALGRQPQVGSWRLVDYTTTGIAGTMIYAAPEDQAPEITLPLNVSGRYAIYIGINYTRAAAGDIFHNTPWTPHGLLWLRLSRDPGFSRFTAEKMLRHADHLPDRAGREKEIWESIHEVYWKTADLDGQSLHIRPPAPPYDQPGLANVTNLSYVRLEPLTPEQNAAWEAEQPTPETRRIAVHWCTDTLTGQGSGSPPYHPTDRQWIVDELVPYFDTDVGTVIMEAIRGDTCCFPSAHSHWGDGSQADDLWQPEWINPLAEAVSVGHEHGIQVFCGLRMMGAPYPVIRTPVQEAQQYWRLQEYAVRDEKGFPTSTLSLAFPQVRQHWLRLLRDGLAFGAGGVHILLNRSMPFVMYEQPVVEAFLAKHSVDPRQLPQDDERWMQHRAEYVTQFLQEVRDLVDEKPGRKLGVTFLTDASAHLRPMMLGAYDVETWLERDLIDILVPTQTKGLIPLEKIRQWKKLARRTQIYTDLQPRTQPGDAYAHLAQTYYEAGADGLYLWDGDRRPPRASEWAVMRRLGHRDLLDRLADDFQRWWQRVPLETLNSVSTAYFSYWDG